MFFGFLILKHKVFENNRTVSKTIRLDATWFVLGIFKFNLYLFRATRLFFFISKKIFMKSGYKMLIVNIFQYIKILFAASSCYIFLTFVVVAHLSSHSHLPGKSNMNLRGLIEVAKSFENLQSRRFETAFERGHI